MKTRENIPSPDALSAELGKAKSPVQALAIARKCCLVHDALVEHAIEKTGAKLACQSGCDLCCYLRVGAKAHEILLIAETIKNKWADSARKDLMANLAANAELVSSLTKNEQCATNVRCPLLIDHQCSVYEIRPLGCRRHHAENFETCQYSYDNPTDMAHPGSRNAELLFKIEYVDGIMGEIFARNGYDQRDYELNMGLLESMSPGKSLRRWKDKKKTFMNAEQE